jgi:hypothetical protein
VQGVVPDITVAPNPSVGWIYVWFRIPPQKPLTVKIYSSQGNVVYQRKIVGRSTHLDLSYLPAGIYVMEINGNGTRNVRKIMLQ